MLCGVFRGNIFHTLVYSFALFFFSLFHVKLSNCPSWLHVKSECRSKSISSPEPLFFTQIGVKILCVCILQCQTLSFTLIYWFLCFPSKIGVKMTFVNNKSVKSSVDKKSLDWGFPSFKVRKRVKLKKM